MIAITQFTAAGGDFADRAREALEALAQRPGYLRGTVARATDDDSAWLLLTEWANVGSYRRALGAYDVRLRATPLLSVAHDVPSAFEELLEVAPGGASVAHDSDREPDA